MNTQAEEAKLVRKAIVDHLDCQECSDNYYFLLKDTVHEFSLSLTTVLACLAFAEEEGAVPTVPPDWWIKIGNAYV